MERRFSILYRWMRWVVGVGYHVTLETYLVFMKPLLVPVDFGTSALGTPGVRTDFSSYSYILWKRYLDSVTSASRQSTN